MQLKRSLSKLLTPCNAEGSQSDFTEKPQRRISIDLSNEKQDKQRSHRPSRSGSLSVSAPLDELSVPQRPLPGVMGRGRSYSRSSIVSQVQVTVETATKAVSTPLCSPCGLPVAAETTTPEARSEPLHAVFSAAKRDSADSGFDNSHEAVNGLPSALVGVEEVRSPKTRVPRPFPLGSIQKIPSCPADLAPSMLHLASIASPDAKHLRRALSSSTTSTMSSNSTVAMPSLSVRRRLQSNGSSLLLGRSAGLDLRLERQEQGANATSAEMQRTVELVMENKLERMPDRQLEGERRTPTNEVD